MGPRASLALLGLAGALAITLVACGDDTTAATTGDMGVHAGSDMAAANCAQVSVQVLDIDTLQPKTRLTAPARLVASATVSGGLMPSWSVERGSTGETFQPTAVPNSNGLSVWYEAANADTWTFRVDFGNGHCGGSHSTTLSTEAGRMVQYILRAVPSESASYTMTDKPLTLIGGSPRTAYNILLDPGTPVSGVLRGPSGGVKGEVRFIGQAAPDAVTVTGTDGSFTLAVLGGAQYTPLLVPSTATLAPHLGATTSGVGLTSASFDVGAGATVSGSIVDGAAAGINGARVTMRAGLLPSGAGQADATGAFTLHAEPATYTLSFGAPDWPEGALAGVAVPAAGASLSIAYTVTRVAVGGMVLGSNGMAVPGARVTIASRPLGTVANVGVGGSTLPAAGRVARVEVTDANGALPAMHLPPGTYDVVVEVPGPSTDGLTAITQVVSGPTTWTLHVDPLLPLSGTVRGPDGKALPNVPVTAIETLGLGAAPTGATDANGVYHLKVGSGTPVQLVVEPVADAKLAGARIALPAGTTNADVSLGPGLQVSGAVVTSANETVAHVRVDALCASCGSSTPVATSITGADGNYKLYLPDPGLVVVDGGAGD